MLKLGAQLYTIRDFMKTEEDFKKSMAKIAEIGYRYVQVSGVGPIGAKAIADITKENGLTVILTHSGVDAVRDRTEQLIEEHNLLGCDIIGVGSVGAYPNNTAKGYLDFARDLAPALEKIKAAGKKFAFHNHKMEFQRYPDADGKNGFELLFENCDPAVFGLTVDTYWVQDAGASPAGFIEAYADRVLAIHLKDMCVIDNKAEFTEILEGNMDFPAVFRACMEHGIDYHFVELDTTRIDPFDSLRISYDNLIASGYFQR